MSTSVCEENSFNICTVKTKVMAFNGRELKGLIRTKILLTAKYRTNDIIKLLGMCCILFQLYVNVISVWNSLTET